jgi:hypothetical protein
MITTPYLTPQSLTPQSPILKTSSSILNSEVTPSSVTPPPISLEEINKPIEKYSFLYQPGSFHTLPSLFNNHSENEIYIKNNNRVIYKNLNDNLGISTQNKKEMENLKYWQIVIINLKIQKLVLYNFNGINIDINVINELDFIISYYDLYFVNIDIINCNNLKKIDLSKSSALIFNLHIENCNKLLSVENLRIHSQLTKNNRQLFGILTFKNNKNMKTINLHSSTVQFIEIHNCNNLHNIQNNNSKKNTKIFQICTNALTFNFLNVKVEKVIFEHNNEIKYLNLSSLHNKLLLEELIVNSCNKLNKINFPINLKLKKLVFLSCHHLTTIDYMPNKMDNLEIMDCYNLKYFNSFNNNPINVKVLFLNNLQKLKYIPYLECNNIDKIYINNIGIFNDIDKIIAEKFIKEENFEDIISTSYGDNEQRMRLDKKLEEQKISHYFSNNNHHNIWMPMNKIKDFCKFINDTINGNLLGIKYFKTENKKHNFINKDSERTMISYLTRLKKGGIKRKTRKICH